MEERKHDYQLTLPSHLHEIRLQILEGQKLLHTNCKLFKQDSLNVGGNTLFILDLTNNRKKYLSSTGFL
jgi:hypothetical protein